MKKLAHILFLGLFALTACAEKPSADIPPLKRPAGLQVLSVTDSSISVRWNYVEAAKIYLWTVQGDGFSTEGTAEECSVTAVGLPDNTPLVQPVLEELLKDVKL